MSKKPYPLTIPFLLDIEREETEKDEFDLCLLRKDMTNDEAFNIFVKCGVEHIDINKNLIIEIYEDTNQIKFSSKKDSKDFPTNEFLEHLTLTHKNIKNFLEDDWFKYEVNGNMIEGITESTFLSSIFISLHCVVLFLKYNIKKFGFVYDTTGLKIFINQKNLADFLHNVFSKNPMYKPDLLFFEHQDIIKYTTQGGKV